MPLNVAAIAAAKTAAGVRQDQKAAVGAALTSVAANHKAATVAALALNVSAAYVEAEAQSVADKVDAVIAALKAAGLMA